MEVETIKKLQMAATPEMEKPREELQMQALLTEYKRISGIEDTIEDIDTMVNENTKHKLLLN